MTGGRALTAFGEFEPALERPGLRRCAAGRAEQTRPAAAASWPIRRRACRCIRRRWTGGAWDPRPVGQPAADDHAAPALLPTLAGHAGRTAGSGQPERGPHTGLAQVQIPAGEHRLALRYGSTPAERAGLLVSGLTALGLLALAAWALLRQGARRARSAPAEYRTKSQPRQGGAGAPAVAAGCAQPAAAGQAGLCRSPDDLAALHLHGRAGLRRAGYDLHAI